MSRPKILAMFEKWYFRSRWWECRNPAPMGGMEAAFRAGFEKGRESMGYEPKRAAHPEGKETE